MTDDRHKLLESHAGCEERLTESEMAEGWHWCNEFDGLLVGPGMGELACCKCLPKDHPVYKTCPERDPHEAEEYERFVASMVTHCHCEEAFRPCDGVLAGGVCDRITTERDGSIP